MPRPDYAPTSHYWDGVQSAYTAGLSYFPDGVSGHSYAAMPMGNPLLAAAAPAAMGAASSVIQRWFGGDAVDQARQERVNYFAQLAANGNVAAAQLILGGPPNVSGNEKGMWETAATLLDQAAPDVMAQARANGPLWIQNSGDTVTNYPAFRRVTSTWASQHPFTSVAGSIAGTVTDWFTPDPPPTSYPSGLTPPGTLPAQPGYYPPGVLPAGTTKAGMSPVVLLALAGGAAFLLLGGGKRRS